MNSVFNLASYNFNQLNNEELLSWLHSESLANMPPIIRTLADRLEDVQDDVAAAQEETKDLEEKFKKLDTDTIEGLKKLDDKLGHFASDLEKVSSAILESQGKILVEGDLLVDSDELDDECPDDQLVIPRKELDAIRAQVDKISHAISNLETGDFFPDRPSI
ncbi:hypothetical protein [uncultured Parasutterella sp.]|jgi:uncharacterized phage infection (PIP) family protein YhgE|uniref:hypothetical protein n=1 Tax=uncultured Parasutterella sp. TaxID=1263098 RepID=UPI0025EC90EE|nr:hypothetical protein [uncultured Parasutterella sp.]